MKLKLKPGIRKRVAEAVAVALPTGMQVLGAGAVLAGVFLLAGLAVALLVGGVAAVAVGVMFEGD